MWEEPATAGTGQSEAYDIAIRNGDLQLIVASGCASAAADAVSGVARDAASRIEQLLERLPRSAEDDDVRAGCLDFASTVARFAGDEATALADAELAHKLIEGVT